MYLLSMLGRLSSISLCRNASSESVKPLDAPRVTKALKDRSAVSAFTWSHRDRREVHVGRDRQLSVWARVICFTLPGVSGGEVGNQSTSVIARRLLRHIYWDSKVRTFVVTVLDRPSSVEGTKVRNPPAPGNSERCHAG